MFKKIFVTRLTVSFRLSVKALVPRLTVNRGSTVCTKIILRAFTYRHNVWILSLCHDCRINHHAPILQRATRNIIHIY
jgi:hypothetical protein